ncbi:uncharacterized protein LACBIDRAFT_331174 [Laccaria bicolor S238N-H82]|uniref:Predicted protein n=1 Tax=Laccaria bicolor (strain S238N-H82 / ATCC MYA-4686) TaxID=486041 RepID=B0DNP0_LACBS|nr:uncharacterized protein LACBIDRAFT_331174 [Laccaria bicolor S238N-H82]EDR03757.1 predicted protein [Laccaria bicolor S238N-H82]|eukprot:XP_001885610.1 predicted protein [Laccaria bicolor S238N-H82]
MYQSPPIAIGARRGAPGTQLCFPLMTNDYTRRRQHFWVKVVYVHYQLPKVPQPLQRHQVCPSRPQRKSVFKLRRVYCQSSNRFNTLPPSIHLSNAQHDVSTSAERVGTSLTLLKSVACCSFRIKVVYVRYQLPKVPQPLQRHQLHQLRPDHLQRKFHRAVLLIFKSSSAQHPLYMLASFFDCSTVSCIPPGTKTTFRLLQNGPMPPSIFRNSSTFLWLSEALRRRIAVRETPSLCMGWQW